MPAKPKVRAIPEGIAEKPSPIVAEAVSRRLDQIGPRLGEIRLLAVASASAKVEEVEKLLSNPLWRMKRKAPRVYEVTVKASEVDALAGEKNLLRWLDLGTRFFGREVPSDAERVSVALAVEEQIFADAKKRLKALGFAQSSEEAGPSLVGEIASAKLAELATLSFLKAIEVREIKR